MAEKAWKRYERAIGAALGWPRIPVPGRHGRGADPGDLHAGALYVEVRSRARAQPIAWFIETLRDARPLGRIPLLVFKAPRAAHGPLVIMRWRDFVEVVQRADSLAAARPARGPQGDPAAAGGGGRGDGEAGFDRSAAAPSAGRGGE